MLVLLLGRRLYKFLQLPSCGPALLCLHNGSTSMAPALLCLRDRSTSMTPVLLSPAALMFTYIPRKVES